MKWSMFVPHWLFTTAYDPSPRSNFSSGSINQREGSSISLSKETTPLLLGLAKLAQLSERSFLTRQYFEISFG